MQTIIKIKTIYLRISNNKANFYKRFEFFVPIQKIEYLKNKAF